MASGSILVWFYSSLVLFCFGSSPIFSRYGFLMWTIEFAYFSDLVFPNEVFNGLFFVYIFVMLVLRSIGGAYCHEGDDWQLPGPIRGHHGGCQRVMTGGHQVPLEETAALPGCRASPAGWCNLSTPSGGPQSEYCD